MDKVRNNQKIHRQVCRNEAKENDPIFNLNARGEIT